MVTLQNGNLKKGNIKRVKTYNINNTINSKKYNS